MFTSFHLCIHLFSSYISGIFLLRCASCFFYYFFVFPHFVSPCDVINSQSFMCDVRLLCQLSYSTFTQFHFLLRMPSFWLPVLLPEPSVFHAHIFSSWENQRNIVSKCFCACLTQSSSLLYISLVLSLLK